MGRAEVIEFFIAVHYSALDFLLVEPRGIEVFGEAFSQHHCTARQVPSSLPMFSGDSRMENQL